MCGRYVVVSSAEEIEVRYNIDTTEIREHWVANRNIGVGAKGLVITGAEPKKAQLFTFGLTPSWAKKKMYLFNARAEGDGNKEDDPKYTGGKGIISKPSFRHAIRSQRCLIPCNGFIEGSKTEKLNKPYYVFMREQPLFSLAGIWETWVNPEGGEIEHSFAIITTVQNELLQKIGHHRMPVILYKENEHKWIDPETHLHDVTALLEPYPAKEMNAFPISPRIKNPRLNDEDLLKPTGGLIFPEVEPRYSTRVELRGSGKRDKHDESGKLTLAQRADLNKKDNTLF
jgi:putative SOS response-associated peptidase YedK